MASRGAPVIQSLVVWLSEGEDQAIRPSKESRRVVARMAPANSTLLELARMLGQPAGPAALLADAGQAHRAALLAAEAAPAMRRLRSPGALPSIVRLCPQLGQVTSMASSSRARSPKVVWEVAKAICPQMGCRLAHGNGEEAVPGRPPTCPV